MTPQTISPGKPRYSAHKVIPAGTDEESSMTPSVLREALPVRTEQESPGKCVQVCDPYECISCGHRVCRRPMKPPLTTAPAPPTRTARQEKHAHAARHTIAEAITLKSVGHDDLQDTMMALVQPGGKIGPSPTNRYPPAPQGTLPRRFGTRLRACLQYRHAQAHAGAAKAAQEAAKRPRRPHRAVRLGKDAVSGARARIRLSRQAAALPLPSRHRTDATGPLPTA